MERARVVDGAGVILPQTDVAKRGHALGRHAFGADPERLSVAQLVAVVEPHAGRRRVPVPGAAPVVASEDATRQDRGDQRRCRNARRLRGRLAQPCESPTSECAGGALRAGRGEDSVPPGHHDRGVIDAGDAQGIAFRAGDRPAAQLAHAVLAVALDAAARGRHARVSGPQSDIPDVTAKALCLRCSNGV